MARRRKTTRKTARSDSSEAKRLKAKLNSIAKVAAVSSGAKKTRAKKKRSSPKKKASRAIVIIHAPSRSASGIIPRHYTPSSRQLTG